MNDNTRIVSASARLRAAAEYVAARFPYENGLPLVCADVGADHGYLSVYLAENGICERVYATEINKGPAEKAKKYIASRFDVERIGKDGKPCCVHLSDIVTVHLADGLDTMQGRGINRAAICGMGGEVISGILERADFVRMDRVKLILQPMSRELELREYLSLRGYEIIDEKLLSDAGRVYTIMAAIFTGEPYTLSPSELILGKRIIEEGGELFRNLLVRKYGHAKNKLSGRLHDHTAESFDVQLYEELKSLCVREGLEI